MSNYYIPNWWSHAPSAIKVREGDDDTAFQDLLLATIYRSNRTCCRYCRISHRFPFWPQKCDYVRGRDCQTDQNCIQFHSLWKYSLHVKQDFFFTTKWNWFISLLFYFSIQWLIRANKSNFARHFDVRKLYLPLLTQWKFVTK